MTALTPTLFKDCVAEASLAPTVHNVQPARWSQMGHDAIQLSCDPSAALTVADPSGRDLMLSCGTVLEGMVMALKKRGFAAAVTVLDTPSPKTTVAELRLSPYTAEPDVLDPFIQTRFTCRGGFAPTDPEMTRTLIAWAGDQPDLHLITDTDALTALSKDNDRLSLDLFRSTAFRQELQRWMRLSPRHKRWSFDGLNAQALALTRAEAVAIPVALSRAGFWLLDKLGLSTSIVSEDSKTKSACAILCLSVPTTQSPITSGRRYYRMCLDLARLGLASWPASVLVDDPGSQAALHARFGLGADQRLVSCLRLGQPLTPPPHRARRPEHEIIAPTPSNRSTSAIKEMAVTSTDSGKSSSFP